MRLWPFGFSTVGTVSFESAAYVARYVLKKVTGDDAEDHYKKPRLDTGELVKVDPEYCTMSRRPGIAKGWFDKFKDDVYPSDFVAVNGKKCRPPRYYDKQLEKVDPFLHDDIKQFRVEYGNEHWENNTEYRLKVRETVQKKKLESLVRNLDSEL